MGPLRLPVFLVLLSWLCPLLTAQGGYRVVHSYPHDPQAFTQGLLFIDGHLYESTGINGKSSLRMVDLDTGHVVQQLALDARYFAEGLTDWGSTLIQLTWQSHVGLVYDRFSFRQLRTFTYPGEGWGLTHDSHALILSDGTAYLRFLDPATYKEVRRLKVTDRGKAIDQLNELEFVRGEIFANVWHSNRVARISPASGKVLGWIDLIGLLSADPPAGPEAVLNGIAYDAVHDRLFVTGKLWPRLFEIRLQLPSKAAAAAQPHAAQSPSTPISASVPSALRAHPTR